MEAAMRKRKERKRHDKLERSGTRRADGSFLYLKNQTFHKKVPYGLAWLLLTDDDEYRFSCLCVGFILEGGTIPVVL